MIVGVHNTGPLIRSKDGFWLAISLPAAGRGGCAAAGSRPANGNGDAGCACASSIVGGHEPAGRGEAAQHEGSGGGVALEDRARKGHRAIVLLVPQVKLPKRLDLARGAERAVDGVPGLILAIGWAVVEIRPVRRGERPMLSPL